MDIIKYLIKNSINRACRLAACILCMALMCACMKEREELADNTPKGNVEALWRIIDEKYCFVEEKGVDWDSVHAEYLKYADTLRSDDYRSLFRLEADMLDHLHDGHVNLYSSFDISSSSAWYEGYPANFSSDLLSQYIGKDYMVAGGMQYGLVQGISDKIGYIRYSSFQSSVSEANFYYVFQYFKDCKGIILDVRNNGGGNLDIAYRMAAHFYENNGEKRLVGYWQHKTGRGHYDFSPMEPIYIDPASVYYRWLRPVIVLCNRRSYSATNSFVSVMRYADNCLIVGGKTGGGGGMPLSYELPNGWMVRLSSVKMYDAEQKSIEEGISPDKEVTLVSKDKDDLIEYAVEQIRNASR